MVFDLNSCRAASNVSWKLAMTAGECTQCDLAITAQRLDQFALSDDLVEVFRHAHFGVVAAAGALVKVSDLAGHLSRFCMRRCRRSL